MQPSFQSLPTDMLTLTQSTLAADPQVRAVDVPALWAERHTTTRNQTASIRSWAWETPTLGWARVAHLHVGARTNVLSVLLFPRLDFDLPLFGTEVVSVQNNIMLAVIDWIPLYSDSPYIAPLAALRQQFASLINSDRLPDWAAASFSPYLFYLRPRDTVEPLAILQAYTTYLDAYLELCSGALPHGDPETTRQAQQRFCSEDMSKTPGGTMLSRLFGEEWADPYAQAFLFRPGGLEGAPVEHVGQMV